MKVPFSLLFLFHFLFSPQLNAASVTFHGKINGASGELVNIMLANDEPFQGKIIYRAKLNENNEFLMGLDITRSQLVKISIGEKSLDFFVSPQMKKIEFETEAQAPEQTIQFKGEDIQVNSFYNSFKRSFQWTNKEKATYEIGGLKTHVDPAIKNKALSYSIEDYFRILGNDHRNQLQYLHSNPSLNMDFYKFLENEINWRYETNKMAYFLFNKDRFTPNDLSRFWVRYGLLRNADINKDQYVAYESFQNLLNSFIHFLHLQTPVKEKLDQTYFTFIRKNLMSRPRYFMLAKLMVNNYQMGNSKLALQEFNSFKRENPYKEYTSILERTFGNEGQYLASRLAPDFKVLDLQERELWLTNFSGKVVYVSFWASWCGPCIKSFRESAEFRKRLKSNGVIFLNVNLDEREDIWRSVLARENIVGENVYGLDMKRAKNELKISVLPYYLLVNKYGKINYLSSSKLEECYNDFAKLLTE